MAARIGWEPWGSRSACRVCRASKTGAGAQDLFGYTLQHTEVGLADQIAAAGTLLLGQAAESIPAVIVRGAPFERREGSAGEINRPVEMDLFR